MLRHIPIWLFQEDGAMVFVLVTVEALQAIEALSERLLNPELEALQALWKPPKGS